MPDIEKVIKAIEICIGDGHCSRCGYHLSDYHAMAHDCRDQMMSDALELLKWYKEHEHDVCVNCPVGTDYTEIVRCKYCNNRGTSDCPIEELCKGWIPSDDWFCADGERR